MNISVHRVRSPGQLANCCGYGFTLIELLVAILLPSLKQAREQARVAVCSSNQRQLGIALYRYAEDNQGRLSNLSYATPLNSFNHHPSWHMAILPYISNEISPERGAEPGPTSPGFGYSSLDDLWRGLSHDLCLWCQEYGLHNASACLATLLRRFGQNREGSAQCLHRPRLEECLRSQPLRDPQSGGQRLMAIGFQY